MRFLYDIGIFFYNSAITIAALWNVKAQKRKRGADKVLDYWPKHNIKRYWFHCASLGEFEMARPLIERLKSNHDCEVLISFFSPSGYEIRNSYALADKVVYLPIDTQKNACNFLAKLQPDVAFFVKYEFWLHFVFEAKRKNIQLYSLASVFHKNQRFFKPWGSFFLRGLQSFDHIFVQDQDSAQLLASYQIYNTTVIGDPRVDRVVENAKNAQGYEAIEQFCRGEQVLICGSTWSEDEAILLPFINKNNLKSIIAPHEIGASHLSQIASKITIPCQRFSDWENHPKQETQVLLIDNIGMLANIYQYGNIAYVGGAFRTGLHNILEPAAFGLPVIFGPHHNKFPEAQQFIDSGFGKSVSDEESLASAYHYFQSSDVKEKVLGYLEANLGATHQVYETIKD